MVRRRISGLLLTLIAVCSLMITAFAEQQYLVGDADGDGLVTIMDATKVQRVLAGYDKDDDGMVALRADLNGGGLDIMDATLIQRWVAGFDDGVSVNEYRTGSPTPTEPSTQGPSLSEYELPIVF